ncbi:MAG: PP2C family protein-serine/threonine phosphatase [Candidatus Dormibacteria bacterium]
MSTGPPWRAGSAELSLHGQDRILCDPELGLFGVFDGVGEFSRSGEAAELASRLLWEACHALDGEPLEQLRSGCQHAHQEIMRLRLGATTVTACRVVGRRLHYVSVGDSRLYLVRAGRGTQVTVDEGEGNWLDNAAGFPGSELRQTGQLQLQPGDRLVLVTDGVTGDFTPDLITEQEIAEAVAGTDPRESAERLIAIARKRDDRSAVVVLLS